MSNTKKIFLDSDVAEATHGSAGFISVDILKLAESDRGKRELAGLLRTLGSDPTTYKIRAKK